MDNVQMHKGDRVQVIKRKPDDYIQRHELSLLALLVERHPERAKEFIKRLGESMKVAA